MSHAAAHVPQQAKYHIVLQQSKYMLYCSSSPADVTHQSKNSSIHTMMLWWLISNPRVTFKVGFSLQGTAHCWLVPWWHSLSTRGAQLLVLA
jgi:hypothetical protein